MSEENDTSENSEKDEAAKPTPAQAPAPTKGASKSIQGTPFVDDEAGRAAKQADDERRSTDETVDWGKYPNKVR